MNNRIFSYAFFKETIRRTKFWTIFSFAFSVVFAFLNALNVLETVNSSFVKNVFVSIFDFGPIGFVATVFAPIMTLSAFSFLTKRHESDYYHVLPISRSAIVISAILAVFSVIAVSATVSTLVYLVVTLPVQGSFVFVNYTGIALEMLAVALAALIGISLTTLAVSITGTVANSIIVAIMLLFAPWDLPVQLVSSIASVAGNVPVNSILPAFNSCSNLYYAVLTGNVDLNDSTPYITSAIITGISFVLAVTFFKLRKSEYATHSFAAPNVGIVIALITAIDMAVSNALISMNFYFIAGTLVGNLFVAVAFYIIYTLVTGRNEKKYARTFACLPIILVSVLLFIGSSFAVGLNLSSYSPEKEDIKSVSIEPESSPLYDIFGGIMMYDSDVYYKEYVSSVNKDIEFDSPEILSLVAESLKNGVKNSDSDYTDLTLRIKGERTETVRRVYFKNDDYSHFMHLVSENTDYKEAFVDSIESMLSASIYGEYLISGSEMEGIVEAFKNEVRELGYDALYSSTSGMSDYVLTCAFPFGNSFSEVLIPINNSLPQTRQIIKNEMKSRAEAELQELKDTLASIKEGNNIEAYLNYYNEDLDAYAVVDAFEHSEEILRLLEYVDLDAEGENGFLSIELYGGFFSIFDNIAINLPVASDADPKAISEIIDSLSEEYYEE